MDRPSAAKIPTIGWCAPAGFQTVPELWAQAQTQHQSAGGQQASMQRDLDLKGEPARQPVGIEITEQQERLEEQHAGGPHRGRAAHRRQKPLGHHRLNLKQEEGAQENRRRIEPHVAGGSLTYPPAQPPQVEELVTSFCELRLILKHGQAAPGPPLRSSLSAGGPRFHLDWQLGYQQAEPRESIPRWHYGGSKARERIALD